MNYPINIKTQIITQGFNEKFHRGVDLRCVNKLWQNQKVICTEQSVLLRQGQDSYGNYFLVMKPLKSDFIEIKYIHLDGIIKFEIGQILEQGDFLGYCSTKQGNSKALHLHFETWREREIKYPVNPEFYFDIMNIDYKWR